jgi:hypothetical protein
MFSAHFDFLHVRIDPLEAIAALGSADIGGTMAAASLIDGWIAEGKSWAGQIACAMMISRSTHVARAVSVTFLYRIISVHVFNRIP